MRSIPGIIILLACFACNSGKDLVSKSATGIYEWSGIYGVGSRMTLRNDQTFEFDWHWGLNSGTTCGSWTKRGNKIILNSELQPSKNKERSFDMLKTTIGNSDSIAIKIVDVTRIPLPFAACILKLDSTTLIGASTNFDGEAILPKLNADSLLVSFLSYKTIRLRLDHSVSAYELMMREGDEPYWYFTDEEWKYTNNRLYSPHIKKSEYVSKDYYEKVQ